MNALAENFRRLGEMFADFYESARGAVQGSCTECVLARLLDVYILSGHEAAEHLMIKVDCFVPAAFTYGTITGFDGSALAAPYSESFLAGLRLGQQCARWAGYEVPEVPAC